MSIMMVLAVSATVLKCVDMLRQRGYVCIKAWVFSITFCDKPPPS